MVRADSGDAHDILSDMTLVEYLYGKRHFMT